MPTIAELLTRDHRDCDHDFAAAERLVAEGRWDGAHQALTTLSAVLEAHFDAEEQILFPRFEAATGISRGPTAMMRIEHAEMRAALERMHAALAQRDGDEFAGEAETLLILMQQHNMKEENILYPMCDAHLAPECGALTQALDRHLNRDQHA
jgi:hemerythrin-like domain-containing protein